MPRIVVTGLGMVSPLGGDLSSSMKALFAGERGIGPLSLFSLNGARSSLAAEAKGLEQGDIAARTDALAVQAAREALAHAGLRTNEHAVHVVVGGSTAGMFETEELLTQLGSIDLTEALEVRLRTHPLSSTVDTVVDRLGPFASARTVCCACTGGAAAIALGLSWIRTGRAERVLAGGADALCRLTYSGFGCLGVLDRDACRPFDKTRAGLNLGEGAGFLVLEREDAARARKATILGEIAGVALGGEAHHITNPEPTGKTAARVMRRALAYAGLDPKEVAYVNAHGTATPHNDAAESAAIRACFGDARPKVSSSKGQIGHTLGAAGAIEAVICVESIRTRRVPPTIGTSEADPAFDVDHVFSTEEVAAPYYALSNSFGFGGTGGSVVVGPSISSRDEAHVAAPRSLVVTGVAAVARGRLYEGATALAGLVTNVARDAQQLSAPSSEDPTAWLDAGKTRRMDRAGKLSAAIVGAALRDADRDASPCDRTDVAAISGTAFGNVDGSMRFMKRVLDKGANLASPADFPNLVPSSPVSHAAIYWGLGGPALATPDLSATAEAAAATGMELVASGVSSAAVVGSVEEVSQLAERVLAPLLGVRTLAAHSEGASGIVIETESDARARNKAPLCRVRTWSSRRGVASLAELPAPSDGARVVSEAAVDAARLLEGTGWSSVERWTTSAEAGDHVGLGGIALAAGASLVATGAAKSVLVLGEAPDRAYAFLLEPAATT
ncbi:MAG: 3-oxoacyl-ACP synthase [Polyangiaceae bacterium]|nr:3-oxoacyl-ACP synthase [Polyangiaceae bacterium]